MKSVFSGLLAAGLALLLAPAGLKAQDDARIEEYKAIVQEAMSSGKYQRAQAENWDARVKKISGDVRIRAFDSDDWAPLLSGEMPLDGADSIKTYDGVAEVYLDAKGVITVGRNTELELASLSKNDAVFSMKFGNIAAKIQHFLDDKFKMEVRIPSAVCAVRGTEFAVEYSQLSKDTGAAVFDEGRLSVAPLDKDGQSLGEYLLEKNTELVFTPSQKRFKSVALSRMGRYKTSVTAMRLRMNVLRKTWKPVTPERRAALRDRILKRGASSHQITNPKKGLKKKNKRSSRAKTPLKNGAKRGTAAMAKKKLKAGRI
jgi:hypothetical protein